jgi:hypothetical protein
VIRQEALWPVMGKKHNSAVAAAIQLLPVAVPVAFMGLLVEVIYDTSELDFAVAHTLKIAAAIMMEGFSAKLDELPTKDQLQSELKAQSLAFLHY